MLPYWDNLVSQCTLRPSPDVVFACVLSVKVPYLNGRSRGYYCMTGHLSKWTRNKPASALATVCGMVVGELDTIKPDPPVVSNRKIGLRLSSLFELWGPARLAACCGVL